jgi:TonB family protein
MLFIKKYPLLLAAFVSFSLHGLMAAYLFPSFSTTSSCISVPVEVMWVDPFSESHCEIPQESKQPRNLKKNWIASDSLKPRNDEHKKQSSVQSSLRAKRNNSGNSMKPITIVNNNYLYHPLPPYPWVCRKRGQEGVVRVCVKTNQNGQVTMIQVAESSGYDLLDQAALNAVKSWVFGEFNTQKTFSIAFRLKGEEISIS